MNILAIDIGTQCGWALGTRDGKVRSGTQSFSPKQHDGVGQRWLRFRNFLTEVGRSAGEVHAVYYEHVIAHGFGKNTNATYTAHMYGGYLAHLQYWCELNNIPLMPVNVATIKKHWTGKGSAKKDAIVIEAVKRGFNPADNNEADAIAILDYARAVESGVVSRPAKRPAKSKKKKGELTNGRKQAPT